MNEELSIEVFKSEHLYFIRGKSATGKTYIWNVCNKPDRLCLGQVRWWGRWRQYCFFPIPDCVWSHDCLQDLHDFILEQNKKRMKK